MKWTFVSKNRSKFIFFLLFPQGQGPRGICLSRLQVRTALALVPVYFSLPHLNLFLSKTSDFFLHFVFVSVINRICAQGFFSQKLRTECQLIKTCSIANGKFQHRLQKYCGDGGLKIVCVKMYLRH